MTTENTPGSPATPPHGGASRLGPFLCWAVVFADIGTSVYYVPGILYGQYGRLAGFFVILTLSVFVLLTIKYAEVTERFPEGGGVVTVSRAAFWPWVGVLGGMLILVDYFLTASLSSLSGIQYFQVIAPGITPVTLQIAIGVLLFLGVLNWWGIRESAAVSAVIAVIAFVSDMFVLSMIAIHVPLATIGATFRAIFSGQHLTTLTLLGGFGGSFLAFSGLESISQLSPVMRVPRKRVAGWALALVVFTVAITSPLLTVFSTTLLCAHSETVRGVLTCVTITGKPIDPNQFISALGGEFGGPWLAVGVAISASALLVFASNTAIIGAYHVFIALARLRFFPKIVGKNMTVRQTPLAAIMLATGIPIFVLIGARGQIDILGDLYAFGLLGAFTLTCLGLDVIRWRERRGGTIVGASEEDMARELAAQRHHDEQNPPRPLPAFLRGPADAARVRAAAVAARWRDSAPRAALAPARARLRAAWPMTKIVLGWITTALVLLAWSVNIGNKPLATRFGGGVTVFGVVVAIIYQFGQARSGYPVVHPGRLFGRVANAQLVVLPAGGSEKAVKLRDAVVRAATEHVNGHKLVFLYVAPSGRPLTPRFMAILDPYGHDDDAQAAFSQAAHLANAARVRRDARQWEYRVGGLPQVGEVWRIVRPDVTVAVAEQGLAKVVQPRFVRFQMVGDVRVAFYIHRMFAPAPRGSRPARFWHWADDWVNGARRRIQGAPAATDGAQPEDTHLAGTPRTTPAPVAAAPAAPPPAGRPQDVAPANQRDRPAAPRDEQQELESLVPQSSLDEAEQWVWTGTELKRRDEVTRPGPNPTEGEPHPDEEP
ncbi:MAG TPA: APC family permease [Ktedonobacterales bacterium]|nr:APC family permease [Ktedonobacterales bacterium]